MAFKVWGIGSLVDQDNFDGTTEYTHLENISGNDINNHITLQRAFRNLYDNQIQVLEFLENIANSMSSGVLKNSFENEFTFSPSDDSPEILIDEGTSLYKYYIRIAPGILYNNSTMSAIFPQTDIAERQLEKIFNLQTWTVDPEHVNISYDASIDAFEGEIIKRNEFGTLVTYTFNNNGLKYNTGIELLEAIYNDSNFYTTFYDKVGEDLTKIVLEPTFEITTDGSYFIGFNTEGELVVSTETTDYDLYIFDATIASNTLTISNVVDKREFFLPTEPLTQSDVGLGADQIPSNEQLLNNDNTWNGIQTFDVPRANIHVHAQVFDSEVIVPTGYNGIVVGDIELAPEGSLEIKDGSILLVL